MNGKRVNLGANTFNIYDLLSSVRGEYKEADKLARFSRRGRSHAEGGHGLSSSGVRALGDAAAVLAAKSKSKVREFVNSLNGLYICDLYCCHHVLYYWCIRKPWYSSIILLRNIIAHKHHNNNNCFPTCTMHLYTIYIGSWGSR